jgi:hypothetical protein
MKDVQKLVRSADRKIDQLAPGIEKILDATSTT